MQMNPSRSPRLASAFAVGVALTALVVVPSTLAGQATATAPSAATSSTTTGKRPLEIADYRLWRTIGDETLSADGRWVAWTYSRVRGDDTVHVRTVEGDRTHTVARAADPRLSADGRWAAYSLAPPFQEVEAMERDGERVPRRAGLLDLATGDTLSWDDVDAFGFSDTGRHFWVKKRGDGDADHDGTDLILRHLDAGYEELLGSVAQMGFNEAGSHFAYTIDAAAGDGNGVYLLNLATGARRALDNSHDRYARLTWSEDGRSLAVLRASTPDGRVERENHLLAFTNVGVDLEPTRLEFAPRGEGLRDGWVVSEKGAVVFDADASTLFVGTKPQVDELEEWPDDGLPLADVNIWHWQDDRIQSQQQRQLSNDRNRTSVAAVHLDDARLVHLADEQMLTVEITEDGEWGIGRDDRAYVSDWKPDYADYYRIDTESGARTPVLQGHLRTLGLSPDSEHYLYWKDGHVWSYRIDDDRHVNLTASAPVDFTNHEFDRFGEKPPHGVAGWTADGEAVLLYDRFDVWHQPLDGGTASSLTQGFGAEGQIRLRIIDSDPDDDFVDLGEPVLFEAFGQFTKQAGFFELDGDELNELTFEDRRFSRPDKAENAERYLFTVESWQEFPDLWVSDGDFGDRDRMTMANPQQDEFLWGTRILFDYATDDGIPLQGTLAIPETYQAGDRLPMIVRFYEKDSQNLHAYPTPTYRHQPNFAGVASRG